MLILLMQFSQLISSINLSFPRVNLTPYTFASFQNPSFNLHLCFRLLFIFRIELMEVLLHSQYQSRLHYTEVIDFTENLSLRDPPRVYYG